MDLILIPAMLVIAYVVGSIPFGLIVVKLLTGKDIRKVASGRTGGTNAGRAAGVGAGIATAVLDALKAAVMVWWVIKLFPWQENHTYAWIHIITPLFVILGHNYSIFLLGRDENGRLRLRGGAGGAPCVGGSMGLWWISGFILVPLAGLILFGIGYASLATMSVALLSTLLFAYRAWIGVSPWQYIFYGILAELLLLWALRPNIKRLLQGDERLIGWRAKKTYQK